MSIFSISLAKDHIINDLIGSIINNPNFFQILAIHQIMTILKNTDRCPENLIFNQTKENLSIIQSFIIKLPNSSNSSGRPLFLFQIKGFLWAHS